LRRFAWLGARINRFSAGITKHPPLLEDLGMSRVQVICAFLAALTALLLAATPFLQALTVFIEKIAPMMR
jgi:hypothetical protein